jgi:hypothetical protein
MTRIPSAAISPIAPNSGFIADSVGRVPEISGLAVASAVA